MVLISFRIISTCLALLLQIAASEQDTFWNVQPVSVVIRSDVIGLEIDQCTSFDSPPLSSAGEEEYVQCPHPTRITDSNKSHPDFEQGMLDSVYIWPGDSDEILFTFSSYKLINSITLHYYANQDNQGLPKLRFFAVPEEFEIGDIIGTDSGYPTALIDKIAPGNEETGLTNKTRNVEFNTTKVLLQKGTTKTFQFYLSEIEFLTSNLDCVDVIATTESPTQPPTTETTTTTTATTGTTVKTETTTAVETTTDTQPEVEEIDPSLSVNIGGLASGESRTHSRVSVLHLTVLALLGALMMMAR